MSATPAVRRLPDDTHVVEVNGSRFLLEWLDRDVLASAAANRLDGRPPTGPGRRAA